MKVEPKKSCNVSLHMKSEFFIIEAYFSHLSAKQVVAKRRKCTAAKNNYLPSRVQPESVNNIIHSNHKKIQKVNKRKKKVRSALRGFVILLEVNSRRTTIVRQSWKNWGEERGGVTNPNPLKTHTPNVSLSPPFLPTPLFFYSIPLNYKFIASRNVLLPSVITLQDTGYLHCRVYCREIIGLDKNRSNSGFWFSSLNWQKSKLIFGENKII